MQHPAIGHDDAKSAVTFRKCALRQFVGYQGEHPNLAQTERRLAAIMLADIAGYSALMDRDESRTFERVRNLREQLTNPKVAEHGGRVIKTTGDGFLAEFPSVTAALKCAIDIQRLNHTQELINAEADRLHLRIGISLGDIIIDGDDVSGTGVNVAARLEPLAPHDGICISAAVRDQIRDDLGVVFEDLGEQQVKNIARPIRAYRINLANVKVSKLARRERKSRKLLIAGIAVLVLLFAGVGTWWLVGRTGPAKEEAAFGSRGPSLAVMPFDNLSGDPAQEPISEGVNQELIADLSRFDYLRVISRNATLTYKAKSLDVSELGRKLRVQYVIVGSFRRVSDQISVTAQLIDVETGAHLWSKSYERTTNSTNLLKIQSEIAGHIAAAVGDTWTGEVMKAESKRAQTKEISALTSYECVLQGLQATTLQTAAEPMRRARTCLEATVKRDPKYVDAWSALARVIQLQRWYGTGLEAPESDDIDKRAYLSSHLLEVGSKAVEIAPESASAHLALFAAYYVTCQPARMRVEADRVLAINPNDARALGVMGNHLGFAGDWDYGRRLAEKGIDLAGPAAQRWWWWVFGKDHFRKGEYAEALNFFQRSYSEKSWLDRLHIVYTLPYLGKVDAARAELLGLLELKPNLTVKESDRIYKMFCFDADFRDRMNKALRLAGMREE